MALLKKPLLLQHLSLKNRLVFPPMATAKAMEDGAMSPQLLEYYEDKTRGGQLGLVIVEHSYISPQGKASPQQLSVSRDEDVEGLKALAKTIQGNGSRAVVQINHAGSATDVSISGLEAIGPSVVTNPRKGFTPRELHLEEIPQIIEDFARAAGRVKAAGFDGVEIHMAHGYLLNQFLSPFTNLREDEYGGDLPRRMRLPLEVLAAVRREVGPAYPVLVRLGACDYMEGGTTQEEGVKAALMLEKAGADLLDLSGGLCGYTLQEGPAEGYFAPMTQSVKARVGIPVILTGGIISAQTAETLLKQGMADLIGVGRALYADSQWPQKQPILSGGEQEDA